MLIETLGIKSDNAVYYSKEFMDVLESFMNYFRKSTTSNTHIVDQTRTLVYEGDLYGYLNEKGIEPYLHWVIMRASGLSSPHEFNQQVITLIVPSIEKLEQIRISFGVFRKRKA